MRQESGAAVHRTRSLPIIPALVAALLLASGCAGGSGDAGPFQGRWRSEGFGLLLDVSGSIDVYEYTSVSCGRVAGGSGIGSGEILGLLGDRLILAETARTIAFDRIDALPEICSEPFRSDDPADAYEVLVATMVEHYAFFDLREPGWPDRAAAAAAGVVPGLDDSGLLRVFQDLLGPLGDAQVRIAGPGRHLIPEGAWSAGRPPAGVADLAARIRSGQVPGVSEVEISADGGVVGGLLPGGVGYLAINRLAGFDADPAIEERLLAEALTAQLGRFGDAPGLVVDLRVNRGGRENLAMLTASRFVAADTLVATRTVRVGGTDTYVDGGDVVVGPMSVGPYPAPIVVLVGPGTSGAGEWLALALGEVPGAILVGSPTAGSLSPLLVRELPNGWTLGLSHQRVLDARGVSWEGRGIPVDVVVTEPATDDHDPVIEAALAALG
ncbi:MAG: S41 family peptidase [Actinomycetota bacterium]